MTNILPGLREVRSPLAAGYLWVIFGWLLLRDTVPAEHRATGLIQDIYDLSSWLGKSGLLVVIGFVAYLIGILSVALTSAVLSRLTRIQHKASDHDIEGSLGFGPPGKRAVRNIIYSRVIRLLGDERNHPQILDTNPRARALLRALSSNIDLAAKRRYVDTHVSIRKVYQALSDDVTTLPTRLMLTRPEAFTSYDRIRAEGEFRGAVSLPLLGISAIVSLENLPLGLILALISLLLAWSGVRRILAANDELAAVLQVSNDQEAPALANISPSTIEIVRAELSTEERLTLKRIARASAKEDPISAIGWYTVLAATDDQEAHERLYDLTLEFQPQKLEVRLGDGAPHSGYVAAQFVAYLVHEREETPETAAAAVRGLLFGIRDEM